MYPKTRFQGLRRSPLIAGIALAAAGGLLPSVALAQDHCDLPATPVVGLNSFDLAEMTTSWFTAPCFKGDAVHHDIWFCFESPVDGVVNISTCGLTNVDTRIVLWPGCGCPDPDLLSPLCCAENECGKQSDLVCEVECGVRYMIQLGSAADGDMGSGDFLLAFDGDDCDPGGGGGASTPPSGPCDECGEGDPGWLDQAGFAGGQIMLFTRDATSDLESPLLSFDLTDEASAPLGSNWAAPTWTHPDWTRANLGTVFGVTIDGVGNAFLAHSSVYNYGIPRDAVGALGAPGAIYQIDSATGAPSLFATLPQTLDPSIQPASEAWPGIGNIAWDFDRDVLFASNMDDGRIYRVDSSGSILDAWDHATDLLTVGGASEANDADGFAPLGERVWAVCPTVDRLYYSVWWEDSGNLDITNSNEIWSVRLDPSGAIVPGSKQLEIQMPAVNNGSLSNPVADIAFDENCCMLTAERSMSGPTMSGAHNSRGMRFCHDGSDWTLGTHYVVGYYGVGNNTAGGVDFDGGPEARSWFSADAINFPSPYLYGATGIPVLGDTPDQSVIIDIDVDVSYPEKFQMGSLELTCFRDDSGPCLEATGELECLVEDGAISIDYALELEITNNSSTPAHYLLIAGPVSPGVINLVPELGPGETRVLDLLVQGPIAGETVCIQLTLFDADFGECCGLGDQELCLVIPECDCAIDEAWEITCIDEAAGLYEIQFDLVNLSPDVVEHVFLITDPGALFVFDENHFDVPATPPFGTMSIGPVTITTSLAPGDTIPFVATLHVQNLAECCDLPLEITLPSCDGESNGNPADLDGDGVVGSSDLGIILANWGGSGVGDLDGDGVVGASDLGMLLASFGMTP